ncbi:YceD family protein [Roseofilum sp. BLCC_M154]|uniref:YceD family protein n=1 Tax=Roseofilum acuticapitatum BLCC-M154 TaxID=3022444 RepID=A0ABT7ASE5_9CYAN|nr:YceD family protein [Roseofilum acuticapitatum]MDJ1169824.1 YceD family protein [Roseofilum acuticapitatum BLCC-M154]
MQMIYIPGLLKCPEGRLRIEVDQYLEGLDSLMPVQGWMKMIHQGSYLEVKAIAETIITLKCDRCLQQYNHRLRAKAKELIWLDPNADTLNDNLPLEREVPLEDLVETLSPQGHFDPETWLYEQLCLRLPHRQLCDKNCPGIEVNEEAAESADAGVDARWSALASLKDQFPK